MIENKFSMKKIIMTKNKISMKKKYQTRDGREIKLLMTDSIGLVPNIGAVREKNGEWYGKSWFSGGKNLSGGEADDFDLVEIKPRIKRTLWITIYPDMEVLWHTKLDDDNSNNSGEQNRLACIKVKIDCEEGEGL